MTPGARHLVFIWAVLMGLSAILAVAGDVGHPSRLGAPMILALALAAALKAHLVLRDYLGLRAAPGALKGFTAAAIFTLAVVVASFLVFRTPAVNAAKHASGLTFVKDQISAAF